jgi:hypothetical protein
MGKRADRCAGLVDRWTTRRCNPTEGWTAESRASPPEMIARTPYPGSSTAPSTGVHSRASRAMAVASGWWLDRSSRLIVYLATLDSATLKPSFSGRRLESFRARQLLSCVIFSLSPPVRRGVVWADLQAWFTVELPIHLMGALARWHVG